jgi:membrane fusion protein (multidrug efflux system)
MDTNSRPESVKPGWFFFAGWLGVVILVVLALGGLVLATNLLNERNTAALQQQEEQGALALVVPVKRVPGTRSIELPGDVHGFYESPIYAKVPGYVKTMLTDKGAVVKAGQVLARIDSPETDQAVANALANYKLQAITDARDQVLVRNRVIATQDADTQHALMLQAKATYEQQLALQKYEIVTAPFDGMIIARNVDPGAFVSQGGVSGTPGSAAPTGIYNIATLKPLRVYVQMPQDQAPFIRDGDPAVARVEQYPQQSFKGSVTRHPSALAWATRTMLVEVDLPNDNAELLPGMYARVAIAVSGAPSVPVVPDSALIFDGAQTLVPVINDNKVHLAPVTLGYDDGVSVQVTQGLGGDEMVATNLGQTPIEGERVHTAAQPQR